MMRYDDQDAFLASDSYVRARFAELIGVGSLTSQQATKVAADQYKGHQYVLSKFLWRVTSSGIAHLRAGLPLVQKDFV